MKIKLDDLNIAYKILHPRLAVIIGSGKYNKEVNFMACSWITPIMENIFGIAIDKSTYTYQLIEKYNIFSVNILSFDKKDLIYKLGTTSGKDINKVKEFGLKVSKGNILEVPILEDSIAFAECRVINSLDFEEVKFYAGKVENLEYEDEIFDKSFGYDLNKIKLPFHVKGKYFRYI